MTRGTRQPYLQCTYTRGSTAITTTRQGEGSKRPWLRRAYNRDQMAIITPRLQQDRTRFGVAFGFRQVVVCSSHSAGASQTHRLSERAALRAPIQAVWVGRTRVGFWAARNVPRSIWGVEIASPHSVFERFSVSGWLLCEIAQPLAFSNRSV